MVSASDLRLFCDNICIGQDAAEMPFYRKYRITLRKGRADEA
jgi:hypothetical protein